MLKRYFMPILAAVMLAVFVAVDLVAYATGWTWTFSDWMAVWGQRFPVATIGGWFVAAFVLAWHFFLAPPQPPFPPPLRPVCPKCGFSVRDCLCAPWIDVRD